MEIWVVGFGTGAYDSRRNFPVCAYSTKEKAEFIATVFRNELAAANLDSSEACKQVSFDDAYWRGHEVDLLSGAWVYVSGPFLLDVPFGSLPKKFGTADDHIKR